MKNNEKILLVGPWIGEFGWELFTWQGFVRRISRDYDKIIVVGKRGNKFLYEDFLNEYVPIDLPPDVLSDSWFCRDKNMRIISTDFVNDMIKNIEYTERLNPATVCNGMFLMGGDGIARFNNNFINQDFVKYKSNTINKNFDIVIHPRSKPLGVDRNWNKENWQELVNFLKKRYTIAVVGNNEAFMLDDVVDYRNSPIEDTVSLFNRTKLVVGQSSGPLHLASLCGTRHLVWSEEYNRNRYIKYWNPFNTPVYFYSEMGWNPTPEFIYNKIIEIL